MPSSWYGPGIKAVIDNDVDFVAHTIKMALLTDVYVPNFDTHDNFDDLAGEVSGTGYVAGGMALAGKTSTVDAANDRVEIDCDDVTWTTATVSGARYAAIYRDTGTPATSALLALIDFNSNFSSAGGNFVVTVNAEGLLQASYAP